MTDRVSAFTVILEQDHRIDSEFLDKIHDALAMVSGVARVEVHIADPMAVAVASARRDLEWQKGLADLCASLRP